LLLLRAVFAISLLVQGDLYFREADSALAARLVGLTALSAGALLLVGFLTPIAGAVAGLGAIGVRLSLLPPCANTLYDSRLAIIFAITILVGIIVLGPGAISLDARIFGRREIIIPPPISPSDRLSI
jgi:uncharacterized membrane protein YphA (DoxX/SURF4 family)